jgi:hypothetical protein
MFWWSCIFLFILLCPPCFGAGDGGCTERTLIVAARDSSGKDLAYPLQASDFRGKIDNKPMQILAITKATNPVRVVLVLDASGSMLIKWQRAVEFAAEIVRESPSSTEFALALFADKEFRTVEFGKTGPEMVNEIKSFRDVKPSGRKGLRDAIWKTASMFQPSREGDTIVVVSDGEDNQGKVSPRQLREAMWSRGIRVMFVQFVDHYFSDQFQHSSAPPTPSSPSGPGSFETNVGDHADASWLPDSSGGFLSRIEDPQVLPKVAHDFASEIANYLAVRITLPTPLEKPASLHLEAVDASGRKRKNIELGFPEKLLPCASLASTQ